MFSVFFLGKADRTEVLGVLYSHAICLSLSIALQGTILIAVNPLQKVADPEMSNFMNRSLDPESPHPYAIAEVRFDVITIYYFH